MHPRRVRLQTHASRRGRKSSASRYTQTSQIQSPGGGTVTTVAVVIDVNRAKRTRARNPDRREAIAHLTCTPMPRMLRQSGAHA